MSIFTSDKPHIRRISRFLTFLTTVSCVGILIATICTIVVVIHYSRDLPDYKQLAEYTPAISTRLYAANGQMIEEYATEKRLFVPIHTIPKRVTEAFIAAEDKNFYHHPGIDVVSIVKAAFTNIINYQQNRRLVGASTITQQVVKNFLLTNERSLDRKIKEAILAFRVTQAFPKEKILELYLNEIYLGNRSYGVAAAALNYFNKSLNELTVEEAAMLAALPKAPSHLDPYKYPERAKERRDWVVVRMEEEGFIDDIEATIAVKTPITLSQPDSIELVNTGFFADAVKKELIEMYSEKSVYEKGFSVRTTIDPELQQYAEQALIDGLLAYDKRHGWRGPIARLSLESDWQSELAAVPLPAEIGQWQLAIVKELLPKHAEIAFKDGSYGEIAFESMKWARAHIDTDTLGDPLTQPSDILVPGDVIAVSQHSTPGRYVLQQIPNVNGSIVAMDPYTGQVKAMVGGYYYNGSQFNRAIQAKRQPGSALKPFVYLAALENGFAPNSIIIDEEIQLDRGEGLPEWRPQNHSGKFYGPTTLRVGIEKSRNAMTVRLAQLMGVSKVVDVVERFKISKAPERSFALVLGSTETTLLNLVNGYASLVNGGKQNTPALVEYIQNSNGKIIYRRDNRDCEHCLITGGESDTELPPFVFDQRQTIADPIASYQIVSILEGAVQRGTGRRARALKKTLGGKTGTTNDSFDAWFLGFSHDLVCGVFVGFDTPRSLGKHEYGSTAALPIWVDFMGQALKDKPDVPFRRPKGIKLVKIDAETGLLPTPTTPKHRIIYEAFKQGTEPTSSARTTLDTDTSQQPDISDFGNEGVY